MGLGDDDNYDRRILQPSKLKTKLKIRSKSPFEGGRGMTNYDYGAQQSLQQKSKAIRTQSQKRFY